MVVAVDRFPVSAGISVNDSQVGDVEPPETEPSADPADFGCEVAGVRRGLHLWGLRERSGARCEP
jgi:hypothetical protein